MARKRFELEWSDEELRCAFNAVVVKNSSIAQRYPGGMSAFVELCPFNDCNEKITAYSSMGGEVSEVIDELHRLGFKHKVDYLFVDAGLYLMCGDPGPFNVDLGISWLSGRYEERGVYVRFVESAPGIPRKPCKMGATPEPVSEGPELPIGDAEPPPTTN
jgi:hypothetical protein